MDVYFQTVFGALTVGLISSPALIAWYSPTIYLRISGPLLMGWGAALGAVLFVGLGFIYGYNVGAARNDTGAYDPLPLHLAIGGMAALWFYLGLLVLLARARREVGKEDRQNH